MSRTYNVGVVGATGAVGQEVVRLLETRAFPIGELRLFASSAPRGRPCALAGTSCRSSP